MAEGKKIIRVNSRTVRDVVIHVVPSLITTEENCFLLAGFAAACWQQKDEGLGTPRSSVEEFALVINPGPSGAFTPCSPICPPPRLLSQSLHITESFMNIKKFHWLHCDPTQS